MKKWISIACGIILIFGVGIVLFAVTKDKLNPPQSKYPNEDQYDSVVVDGEDYFLVKKQVSTYDAEYTS